MRRGASSTSFYPQLQPPISLVGVTTTINMINMINMITVANIIVLKPTWGSGPDSLVSTISSWPAPIEIEEKKCPVEHLKLITQLMHANIFTDIIIWFSGTFKNTIQWYMLSSWPPVVVPASMVTITAYVGSLHKKTNKKWYTIDALGAIFLQSL